MKRRSIVNFSCGLCERPVTGVHFLWDNATGREATVWLHGDEEEDQCFMSVSKGRGINAQEKSDECKG